MREGPDTVAAFFAEPVMGAGGVIVPPATYFDRIQPILKKYDILFVVDEVICGFGRTGNLFGSQTFNLEPDMITVAKALSAGYLPISATMVSNALYEILLAQSDKLGIFGHGYTYSSHPVPAAVALETLKIYEERDIVGAGAARRSAPAGGDPQLRRASADRRRARHRPDRRRRAGARQGDARELRRQRPAWPRTWSVARSTTARSCATCPATSSRSARR